MPMGRLYGEHMFFGDANQFAIEAVFRSHTGKWLFGSLRFYVGHRAIGDFDDSADLASSARWGRTFLAASNRRTRRDLDSVSADEVYELLQGRYLVEVNAVPRVRKPVLPPFDKTPFVLDDVGESSLRDTFGLLAVRRGDGCDRLILKDWRGGGVSEMSVVEGKCDSTVAAYCGWVESLLANISE